MKAAINLQFNWMNVQASNLHFGFNDLAACFKTEIKHQ